MCLKPGLKNWKWGKEGWKTEFYVGFIYILMCILIVLNL